MKKQGIVALLFIFILFQLIMSGCRAGGIQNKQYVVKINQYEVSKQEFMVYLREAEKDFESIGGADIWETDFDGQTAEEAAKDSALSGLKMVKVSVQKAEALGVSLTDEELKEAEKEAEIVFEGWSEKEKADSGVTLENVKKVMTEKSLYSKVNRKVTENLEVNENDFASYYQKSREEFTNSYTEYVLDYIFTIDINDAEIALERVKAGEDFSGLIQEYDNDDLQDNNQREDYRVNLEASFGIVFDLEQGETSGILNSDKGYYIFKVLSKNIPTDGEVEQRAREYYIENMKQLLFTQEYEKWISTAEIEKNQDAWQQISIEK